MKTVQWYTWFPASLLLCFHDFPFFSKEFLMRYLYLKLTHTLSQGGGGIISATSFINIDCQLYSSKENVQQIIDVNDSHL